MWKNFRTINTLNDVKRYWKAGKLLYLSNFLNLNTRSATA